MHIYIYIAIGLNKLKFPNNSVHLDCVFEVILYNIDDYI